MRSLLFVFVFIKGCLFAQDMEELNYSFNGKAYCGFVAKPKSISKKTKTILIVHEWWGLNDYPKQRAKQLSQYGFIAICVDMYGKGINVDNPKDASTLAGGFYGNSVLMYQTFMAGFDAAIKVKGVNPTRMAAIGYCFGGSVVLNAAIHGAKLDAVVSFHGGLKTDTPEKGTLKAAILICNGAADKFVSQEEIETFDKQMKTCNADYTFINYPDATHAFTNPFSTETGKKFNMPIAYNEAADKKSYTDFLNFIEKKVR